MMTTKNKKIWRAVSLILALLLAAFALGTFGYGWLSENRSAYRKNIKMSLSPSALTGVYVDEEGATHLLSTTENTTLPLSGSYVLTAPGSKITMDIGVVNKTNQSATVKKIGFKTPTVWHTGDGATSDYDEVPVNGNKYFGTQLRAAVTSYTVYTGSTISGESVSLTGGTTTTVASPTYYTLLSDPANPAQVILMTKDFTVGVNKAVIFHIEIQFEDKNENQNDYMNFGRSEGKFSRSIYIDVAQ